MRYGSRLFLFPTIFMLVMNSHVREILRFVACTQFLRKNVHHFIPIKNKMIRCPLRRPRPLRHPPLLLLLPSLLLPPSPSPFAFDPCHRRSPTTAVALVIALVAVARLHRRLHCCCCRHSPPLRHPSPSSPSPSPTLSPLPSPSSPSLALVAVALAAVALALFVARHPRRSNILFQLRIK